MLRAKEEVVSWNMKCSQESDFRDPTQMSGSLVSCVWTSPDTAKTPVYATFFYFTPQEDTNIENVIIFSDFGKGLGSDAVKDRAVKTINTIKKSNVAFFKVGGGCRQSLRGRGWRRGRWRRQYRRRRRRHG